MVHINIYFYINFITFDLNIMGHIAILLSGHLRNFEDIIHNFYDNFIKQIMLNHNYDLYIHTLIILHMIK